MSINQIPLCLLCAALGAGLVKVADRFVPDDSITAKRVVVTNDEGKPSVQIDGSGIQVMAEDSDSYSRIKANDLPLFEVVRDGATVASLGQNIRGTDGLILYHGGKVAVAATVNDRRAIVGVSSPREDGDSNGTLEELLSDAKGFATLTAGTESSAVSVRFGSSEKSLTVPDAR